MDHTSPTMKAIDRTPAEIWTLILICAIQHPLLPSSDKSLLPNVRIFNNNLEIFREAYRTHGRLRLVCSAWDEILKIYPLKSTYWRGEQLSLIPFSAVRIDIGDKRTFDSQLPWSLFSLEYTEPREDYALSKYPNVGALALTHSQEDHTFIHLFPNLRLLSTLYLDPDRILSTFPNLLLNLTHLQVPRIYASNGHIMEANLTFPHLHTLRIDPFAPIAYRGASPTMSWIVDPGSSLDCLNWSLPSLVNLGFWGVGTDVYKDIDSILERFGPGLKGFSFTRDSNKIFRPTSTPLPSKLWDYCPNLSELYCVLTTLTAFSRPPSTHPPIRFIISDIHNPEFWQSSFGVWGLYHHDTSLFAYLASSWRVSSLEMDTTWSVLQKRLQGFTHASLELASNFFNQISQDGPYLKDRLGEGMDSTSGQAFMNSLRSITEGLIKDKNQNEDLAEEPEAEFTDIEDGSDSSIEDDYIENLERVDYSYLVEGDNWLAHEEDDSDGDYYPDDESYDTD
ncbi:hypothetical protein CPB86DRAFT_872460 [Serendipita vermifera]|nr:hypothetical protein CPB86DRAFT_872460 [Serendipita vermifera]